MTMAPGVEMGDLNYLGMGLAILANIVIGFLWYAPWAPTGKLWMRETGMKADQKVPAGAMAVSMALMVVGAVLLMFVLTHTFVAYRDAYRLDQAGYDLTVLDGVVGGFMTWLGFIVPIHLNGVAFERRSWAFFAVNAGYYLVSLVVAGILIATVGA